MPNLPENTPIRRGFATSVYVVVAEPDAETPMIHGNWIPKYGTENTKATNTTSILIVSDLK